MNKEKVKEIIDNFEDENFVDAKEKLKVELKNKIEKHFVGNLGLKKEKE